MDMFREGCKCGKRGDNGLGVENALCIDWLLRRVAPHQKMMRSGALSDFLWDLFEGAAKQPKKGKRLLVVLLENIVVSLI